MLLFRDTLDTRDICVTITHIIQFQAELLRKFPEETYSNLQHNQLYELYEELKKARDYLLLS